MILPLGEVHIKMGGQAHYSLHALLFLFADGESWSILRNLESVS